MSNVKEVYSPQKQTERRHMIQTIGQSFDNILAKGKGISLDRGQYYQENSSEFLVSGIASVLVYSIDYYSQPSTVHFEPLFYAMTQIVPADKIPERNEPSDEALSRRSYHVLIPGSQYEIGIHMRTYPEYQSKFLGTGLVEIADSVMLDMIEKCHILQNRTVVATINGMPQAAERFDGIVTSDRSNWNIEIGKRQRYSYDDFTSTWKKAMQSAESKN